LVDIPEYVRLCLLVYSRRRFLIKKERKNHYDDNFVIPCVAQKMILGY